MTLSETTSFTDEELAKERFDEFLEEGFDALEMKDFICLLYTSPSPRDRG